MIIIPAAGEGRRFKEAGYSGPKHEIDLVGRPMVDWVVDNVRVLDPHGKVVVATQGVVGQTKGAVDTVRRALNGYPPQPDEPLIIANCDQLIAIPEAIRAQPIGHGLIFTFKSASPAHSYVTTTKAGRITSIVEKPDVPPSDRAVSGVYYFANPAAIATAVKDAHALAQAAEGEEYLSEAIARMIHQEYSLYAVDVPTAILGTPEDFQRFETAFEIQREMFRTMGAALVAGLGPKE